MMTLFYTWLIVCQWQTWSKIICRLLSYPSSSPDTTVNTVLQSDSTIHHFTGQELLKWIWFATVTLGLDKLGFSPDQLRLHSARSGATMVMNLAGFPVFTIMLWGHWSSNAFLHYICKQVKEVSSGISNRMISNKNFFTISNTTPDNPVVPNLPLNPASRPNIGFQFKGTVISAVSSHQNYVITYYFLVTQAFLN